MPESRKQPVTDETRDAVLSAAWSLIITRGRADASMAEIARQAGVTRQTVYLAFGSRAGLLIAMARKADAQSPHSARMAELVAAASPDRATLEAFVDAWIRHLPEVFPMGRILIAAAATDADAAAVLHDRMEGGLLEKYLDLLKGLEAAGELRPGMNATRAADLLWSITHLDSWRHLVAERGWTPEAFAADRMEILRRHILR